MKKELYETYQAKVLELFEKASIVTTEAEKAAVEIADMGLGDFENTGLGLVTYVNTDRCCAKELALLPGQTCPEHIHAPIESIGYPGKEETFRCRYGVVYLYIEGEPAANPQVQPPAGTREHYTVSHEIVLHPGEQFTMKPNTKHWFQGGKEGCVVSEFSTKSYDEYDIFTNPNIKRDPCVAD